MDIRFIVLSYMFLTIIFSAFYFFDRISELYHNFKKEINWLDIILAIFFPLSIVLALLMYLALLIIALILIPVFLFSINTSNKKVFKNDKV